MLSEKLVVTLSNNQLNALEILRDYKKNRVYGEYQPGQAEKRTAFLQQRFDKLATNHDRIRSQNYLVHNIKAFEKAHHSFRSALRAPLILPCGAPHSKQHLPNIHTSIAAVQEPLDALKNLIKENIKLFKQAAQLLDPKEYSSLKAMEVFHSNPGLMFSSAFSLQYSFIKVIDEYSQQMQANPTVDNTTPHNAQDTSSESSTIDSKQVHDHSFELNTLRQQNQTELKNTLIQATNELGDTLQALYFNLEQSDRVEKLYSPCNVTPPLPELDSDHGSFSLSDIDSEDEQDFANFDLI